MNEIVELYALVSGKVQGVGFRWTVVECADKHHLHGTVRNLSNGKVEVVAQGSRESIDAFIVEMKRVSYPARVESVDYSFRKPKEKHSQFKIIH